MSKADKIFKTMCRDILDNGCSTEGEKVRPKWDDGSFAYTIKRFGVVNRYDLREEFPALTLRKTELKNALADCVTTEESIKKGIMDENIGVEMLLIKYSKKK